MKNDSLILLLSAALFFPLLMILGYLLVSEDYYIGIVFFVFPLANLPLGIYGVTRKNKTKAITVLSVINIVFSIFSIVIYMIFAVLFIGAILMLIRLMIEFVQFFRVFPFLH